MYRKHDESAQPTLPLWARLGRALLFLAFLALLAGRFTLDRVSSTLPSLDLRWAMLGAILVLLLLWHTGAEAHLPKRITVPGTALFVVWSLWMSASVLWAQPAARVGRALEDQFFLTAFVLVIIVLIGWLPAAANQSLWTWFYCVGIVYFIAAIAAGPGINGRYSAFGGGPNVFVRIMAIAGVAAIFLAITRNRLLPLVTVPVFALGALLSGSRGGLIAAAAILLLSLFPLSRQLGLKRVLGLLASGYAVYLVADRYEGGQLYGLIEKRFIEQTFEQGYASDRNTISGDALRIFTEHPILGAGIDGYYALQGAGTAFEYPHNLLLASAAEGGIIGATLLIAAVFAFVRTAMKRGSLPPMVLAALMSGGIMLVAGMFSGDYYDSRFMWMFLALAAVENTRRLAARPDPAGPVPPELAAIPPETAPTSQEPGTTDDQRARVR